MLISSQAFAADTPGLKEFDNTNLVIGNLKNNKLNSQRPLFIFGTIANYEDNLIIGAKNELKGIENKGTIITGIENIVTGIHQADDNIGHNHVYGHKNVVNGAGLSIFGKENTVNGSRSFVFGRGNKIDGEDSANNTVLGLLNRVNGVANVVLGESSEAQATEQGGKVLRAVAIGNSAKARGTRAVAIGNEAKATKEDSIAVGGSAKAESEYAIAAGFDSKASGKNSIAVGNSAQATAEKSMAFGFYAKSEYTNSVAIGASSRTTRENEVSFGRDKINENNPSIKRILSNVAEGTNDYDVTNKKQVDAGDAKTLETAKQFTTEQIALEATKREEGDTKTLANAKLFTAGKIVSEALKREAGDAKTLEDANQYTDGKIASEVTLREDGDRRSLVDAKQYTDDKFSPLNTKVAGIETKITATDGKITQVEGKVTQIGDKVTDVETKVAGVDSKIVQAKNEVVSQITAEVANREAGDTQTLQTANQYTDLKLGTLQTQVHNFQSDFNELNGKLGKLDSKLERGLAAANALSGLVLPQVVGKASFSAAVGGYGSRNAVAIGVGYTPKANITLKSGIAVNAGKNSKISYQMGAGWVW
ncbi:YadA-like family protein [Haemophilus haemolyticus]|uniref:YadA-like family protein n=1 Tax=Haemophilus haemolyticus TaxID=726 RepID=UPI000E58491A|nr:YadA-like family protein [Haemophilus haemolyticus]